MLAQYTYRVEVDKDGRGAHVMSLPDMGDVYPINLSDGYYEPLDSLPTWMQERLVVLSTMPHEPPTEPVRGIGKRIDENVFWVFVNKGGE
jgi:hypothetical protein|tara:strand:+ start:232 stop:501 length:270 start_codon:yes stop_codon:yes gene_type:complete